MFLKNRVENKFWTLIESFIRYKRWNRIKNLNDDKNQENETVENWMGDLGFLNSKKTKCEIKIKIKNINAWQ